MSLKSRHVAPLLVGLWALASIGASISGSIWLAPTAAADPPSLPTPGSESAAATIRDLDANGYDVQLQFENGLPNVGLSQCTVSDINTVGSAGTQKLAYVTISCPK